MTENIAEIWKPVKGYENLYEVSSLGVVKRIGGYVSRGKNTLYVPGKTMIPFDNGKGYFRAQYK